MFKTSLLFFMLLKVETIKENAMFRSKAPRREIGRDLTIYDAITTGHQNKGNFYRRQ